MHHLAPSSSLRIALPFFNFLITLSFSSCSSFPFPSLLSFHFFFVRKSIMDTSASQGRNGGCTGERLPHDFLRLSAFSALSHVPFRGSEVPFSFETLNPVMDRGRHQPSPAPLPAGGRDPEQVTRLLRASHGISFFPFFPFFPHISLYSFFSFSLSPFLFLHFLTRERTGVSPFDFNELYLNMLKYRQK